MTSIYGHGSTVPVGYQPSPRSGETDRDPHMHLDVDPTPEKSQDVQTEVTNEVETRTRIRIKKLDIDPSDNPDTVRQLIRDIYSERVNELILLGPVPSLNRSRITQAVYDRIVGYGDLQQYFDDPDVEEIWINGPGRTFIAKHGHSELTNTVLSAENVADLIEKMLRSTGRRVDMSSPFVDASLPDGSRLHVAIPSVTRMHWAVNIRKFVSRFSSLPQAVHRGVLSQMAANFLDSAVMAGLNVIVSGGTQAGKTTMLNCLGAAIPARDRVISCEEVFELKIPAPDWVPMQTRPANIEGQGEINVRRLVVEALRMRPDRVVVGEVRQAECFDMLIALNSGLPGMCSIHANSAKEALHKLCILPLLAGENISYEFVYPLVAQAVDLIVHVEKDAQGHRHIHEIVWVSGRHEGAVIETTTLFKWDGTSLRRTEGHITDTLQFERAGIDIKQYLQLEPENAYKFSSGHQSYYDQEVSST